MTTPYLPALNLNGAYPTIHVTTMAPSTVPYGGTSCTVASMKARPTSTAVPSVSHGHRASVAVQVSEATATP